MDAQIVKQNEEVKDLEVLSLKKRISELESQLEEAKKLIQKHLLEANEVDLLKMKSSDTLTKAKSVIFENTKMIKNQELQIEALNQQVESLRDVVKITKELLEIRNLEVDQLESKIHCMEEKYKAEKERQDLMHKRLEQMIRHNGDLKREYETQLCLFKALRDRYDERELAKGVVENLKSDIKNDKENTVVQNNAVEAKPANNEAQPIQKQENLEKKKDDLQNENYNIPQVVEELKKEEKPIAVNNESQQIQKQENLEKKERDLQNENCNTSQAEEQLKKEEKPIAVNNESQPIQKQENLEKKKDDLQNDNSNISQVEEQLKKEEKPNAVNNESQPIQKQENLEKKNDNLQNDKKEEKQITLNSETQPNEKQENLEKKKEELQNVGCNNSQVEEKLKKEEEPIGVEVKNETSKNGAEKQSPVENIQ